MRRNKKAPVSVSRKALLSTLLTNGKERLRFFEKHRPEMVETICELVRTESPSDNKPAIDRLVSLLAAKFKALGGKVKVHHAARFGNHLQVDFRGKAGGKPVLLLGHVDTVYPLGSLAEMPCRAARGRITGPGVFDMKAGVALILSAIQALQAWHGAVPRPITVFLDSDEEIGSNSSRPITESLAKKSAAVLVLEPACGPHGAVKTARKGVGEYTLKVTGRAAHAGLDFERGQSAVVELARQVAAISEFVQLQRGLTLNIGVVRGGTRSNVVAAEAEAVIDVRIARAADRAGIDRRLRALRPFNRHCKLKLTGGIHRPPLERTGAVAALYEKAREIAGQLGWRLEEAAVGGGSDGNFTAALGVPTLDGLGAVGEGAHAKHESILISELPRRAALLAGLIEAI